MKLAFFSMLSFLITAQAFAGAANTELKCVSMNGKITLSGSVPGDFAEFQLTANVKTENGERKLELYSYVDQETGNMKENGQITLVEDLRNGVYTLESTVLDHEQSGLIRLYAIPRTVKFKQNGRESRSSFRGKVFLYGNDLNSEAEVTCSTHYSI